MSTPLDELAHHGVACNYCGAQPGVWCRTVNGYSRTPGQRATYLHAGRTQVVHDAWRIGYEDGQRHGLNAAAWELEARRTGQRWARPETPMLDGAAVELWLRGLAGR